jgi:hypothetical protein
MGGLLDACKNNLQAQGMRKMFLDGVASGLDSLNRLGQFKVLSSKLAEGSNLLIMKGFEEWAQYRDVWKDA